MKKFSLGQIKAAGILNVCRKVLKPVKFAGRENIAVVYEATQDFILPAGSTVTTWFYTDSFNLESDYIVKKEDKIFAVATGAKLDIMEAL